MNTLSVLLALASLLTGCFYVFDFVKQRPVRKKNLQEALRLNPLLSRKEKARLSEGEGAVYQIGSFFPIILFVFLFRAFLFEPFRIPSGSMEPTLLPGDFIAVQKWSYGIRNPFTNEVMFRGGVPERGDVVVFKYPEDTRIDYIKRIVGLPGDEVIVDENKRVYLRRACIRGEKCLPPEQVDRTPVRLDASFDGMFDGSVEVYDEKLGESTHKILINSRVPDLSMYFHKQHGMRRGHWVVPDGHYFVMGDNRDNSKDSRFWGFVPEEYLVGRTVCIWMSLEFNRDAEDTLPAWVPSGVRFHRIGAL